MPSTSQWVTFLVASILFIQVPGPSLLFTLGRALTVSLRDALTSVVGNALGLLAQVAAVAIGIGAVVAASATAYTVVKVVGAAYVVYLGVQAIRHRADAREAMARAGPSRARAPRQALLTGFMVGLTNPKTIVFFLAFLPQFTDTSHAAGAAAAGARAGVRGAGRGLRQHVGHGRRPGPHVVRPQAAAPRRDGRDGRRDDDRPRRRDARRRLVARRHARDTLTDVPRLPRQLDDLDHARDLRKAIDRTGYYPEVVADAVDGAVAGEQVVSFYVHHEPTFENDEVRRHQSVVVLTPTRLILAHTDEHAGDDLLPEPYTSTSTEAVSLTAVKSVVVTRMTANPTEGPQPPAEAVMTIGWGGVAPPRPRARRLQRPRVRRRPRLHRGPGLRRLLAAGLGRRRRRRRRAGLLSFAASLSARTQH